MKTWRVVAGSQIEGLKLSEEAPGKPSPSQVRVRLHAASLNFRDLMVVKGMYPPGSTAPLVPGSDGAGEVRRDGKCRHALQGGRPGHHLLLSPLDRRPAVPAEDRRRAGGAGSAGGTFAEEIVLDEGALVRSPRHLDYAESSTLTCAGVTAWRALFFAAQLRPGETVVLLGTGGVSIWALQLAKAAGARVIITSSSDAKLARARALGADETINYVTTPEWSGEVRRLTNGDGADVVSRWAAKRPSGSRWRPCGWPARLSLSGRSAGRAAPSCRGS